MGLGIIILLVIIAGLVIFITGMKNEGGFSQGPSQRGIPTESAFDKVKDSLGGLFKPKDEGPKNGKFAWKGN